MNLISAIAGETHTRCATLRGAILFFLIENFDLILFCYFILNIIIVISIQFSIDNVNF